MTQALAISRQEISARFRARYPERARSQNAATRRRWTAKQMVDLRAFKLLRGCFDCGYAENADALQFDHVRGVKKMKITTALQAGGINSVKFQNELSKCEVRCANCHAIRSARQHIERMALAS